MKRVPFVDGKTAGIDRVPDADALDPGPDCGLAARAILHESAVPYAREQLGEPHSPVFLAVERICDGLVSLKLAHETTAIFTVDGRRRLVRYLLGHPEAETARVRDVSVDVRSMKDEVQKGLSRLVRARETITADEAVLSGTPCVKGTRIPAQDVAEMLANGDDIGAIRDAWPVLTEEQIEAATLYARAYPRRGRPRNAPFWRSRKPVVSGEAAFDALPPAR